MRVLLVQVLVLGLGVLLSIIIFLIVLIIFVFNGVDPSSPIFVTTSFATPIAFISLVVVVSVLGALSGVLVLLVLLIPFIGAVTVPTPIAVVTVCPVLDFFILRGVPITYTVILI